MNKTLWQYFSDNKIALDEVSAKTGYSVRYLQNLRSGADVLNDKARFRFIQAFPDVAALMLKDVNSNGKQPDPC